MSTVLNPIGQPIGAVFYDEPEFIAPTLENDWVNYGGGHVSAGYYKDALGRVHLRGLLKDGVTTSGTTVLVLPSGYRPASGHVTFSVVTGPNGGAFGRVNVLDDGTVQVITADSSYLGLDGISFAAV